MFGWPPAGKPAAGRRPGRKVGDLGAEKFPPLNDTLTCRAMSIAALTHFSVPYCPVSFDLNDVL